MDEKLLMVQVVGYIAGGVETIVNQDVTEHAGWDSPEAAVRSWRQRGVYSAGGYRPFENGRECITDVSDDREYTELGISSIFTRVYFVLVPNEPMSAAHRAADLDLV